MASDGLWDALSFSSAAKVALASNNPGHAAERLVGKSMRARGLRDDITTVVLVCGQNGMCSARDATNSEASWSSSGGIGNANVGEKLSGVGGSAPSPRQSRRFKISSLLRAPRPVIADGRELTVKGGKLFEALAREQGMAQNSLSPNGVRRSMSGDSMHSASSVSSGDSSFHFGRAHLQGMQGMQGMRLDEGCESPVPSVDRSAPLFAFLEGEPGVYISPSGSRENLRDSSNGSGA